MKKIAVVTQDGETLSSHFGMAPVYLVFSAQDDQIVDEEEREKPHHQQHGDHNHQTEQGHERMHQDMFAPIADCQVLLCGGMGEPAYRKAQAAGLEVVMTGGKIRPTVDAYLRGELQSDMRRVHRH